jgi:hypothetical protein
MLLRSQKIVNLIIATKEFSKDTAIALQEREVFSKKVFKVSCAVDNALCRKYEED